MEFVVRAACADDAGAVTQLEAEARDALVDARGGRRLLAEQPPVTDWVATIADPQRRVWVAAIGEVVTGYLELCLPAPGGIGVVLQVYVEPGARELGFGDDLLAAAIKATIAAGGVEIESCALPGDRENKNLYERAGVTARKLIVSKRLV